jgi:hypothetical protein
MIIAKICMVEWTCSSVFRQYLSRGTITCFRDLLGTDMNDASMSEK